MLKKILLGVLALVLLLVGYVAYQASKPPASPPDTASFSHDGLELSVDYSRPYKKGRLIFGEPGSEALQAYGQYWRLGANAATELTVNKDFTFGGKAVSAGTYRMFAFPGATSWEIVLNSEAGVFWAFLEPDYDKDVVKVQISPENMATEVEQLTIDFTPADMGVHMNVKWDKTKVSVPIIAQ